jgi:hypothetical protein
MTPWNSAFMLFDFGLLSCLWGDECDLFLLRMRPRWMSACCAFLIDGKVPGNMYLSIIGDFPECYPQWNRKLLVFPKCT